MPDPIETILERHEENGQGEANEIAQFIRANLSDSETPRENLIQAIAMCDAFADAATAIRKELQALPASKENDESNANYERIRRQENGHQE
jgi:hypothetical protein